MFAEIFSGERGSGKKYNKKNKTTILWRIEVYKTYNVL